MWLLDTNILILCNKLKIKQFNKDEIYTTILSLIDYPLGSKLEKITIIFPSAIHYEQAFKNALLLREKGTPIPTIDLLIGTITVEKNLILVSDDNHFKYLQDVDPRLKRITSEIFLKS
ncbi:MAG: type II toxin-antitoxin system VapC family toxin [Promethearchaeota archaeon]